MDNSIRRHGGKSIRLSPRINKEPQKIPGGRWIALTKGKFVLVDESDFAALNLFSWCFCNYAIRGSSRTGSYRSVLMHREILGLADDDPRDGDHIDGNKLDNRRQNLRIATGKENRRNIGKRKSNKSGYKGVSWSKQAKKWHATITVDRNRIHLGYFQDVHEAARVYDAAARQHFGEFARLNFPSAIAASA